jgi:hypothetical protein
MEMILVLFHAEHLRTFILGSIRATKKSQMLSSSTNKDSNDYSARIKEDPLENALRFLVSDGALSPAEKDEIVKLVDHRNQIAHRPRMRAVPNTGGHCCGFSLPQVSDVAVRREPLCNGSMI